MTKIIKRWWLYSSPSVLVVTEAQGAPGRPSLLPLSLSLFRRRGGPGALGAGARAGCGGCARGGGGGLGLLLDGHRGRGTEGT